MLAANQLAGSKFYVSDTPRVFLQRSVLIKNILNMQNMANKFAFADSPLIVILGSTATGKSKLGIALAKALNGEIISADSMQVYKGLDIITNKVTDEEQKEIPHHLINIISPPTEFTVVKFREKALQIIHDLCSQKKVPIIVGGTNYYIESLLWDFLVEDKETIEDKDEALQQRKDIPKEIDKNDQSLFERLKEVDPERAAQLHPNNIRKVARSLQVFESTGKTHSELLADQKSQSGASHLSGPLRFSKVLVFWLTCSQDILDKRISDRMEKMVDEGLAKEITEFYKDYREIKKTVPIVTSDLKDSKEQSSTPEKVDEQLNNVENEIFEDGIFQAIGFKEFHSFISYNEDNDLKREALFREGLEKLKRITIKYSKKQQTWVRNRFLTRPESSVPDVYDLDVSDKSKWKETVYDKALEISTAFMNGQSIPFPPMERIMLDRDCDAHRKYVCDLCDGKIIVGDLAWKAHNGSKGHRKRTRRKRKFDETEALIEDTKL